MSIQGNIDEREEIRRHILRHIPPGPDNPKISFPEPNKLGRIVIPGGFRLIDWEGDEWVAYEKEGARWFKDTLKDDDYKVLHDALADQVRDI